jgi:protein phosphatase PTC1
MATNGNNDDDDDEQSCSFRVGVAEDRNRKCRRTMEDAHTYVYNFGQRDDAGYFAIFDGHAGRAAADWCASKLHTLVESALQTSETPAHALNAAFQEADERMVKADVQNSGCTAAVALIQWQQDTRKLYCGNVGDTRIVLCREGRPLRLTYDHKGSDPNETRRVQNRGGIMMNNRVNGVLAVTRSLGDNYMKEYVTGAPYTTETDVDTNDEFVIIACDGLWDVCDDQTAVDLVREEPDPQSAAQRLVDYALQHLSADNLSCMVVRLN